MSEIKTIIIKLEGSAKDQALAPITEKSVLFADYAAGDIKTETVEKMVPLAEEKLGELAASLENNAVVLNADSESLPSVAAAVAEIMNRHTLVVIAAGDGLIFSGYGITRDYKESPRAAKAEDVIPTICYLTGLHVPADSTGAVLYQALKDVNAPYTQVEKLQASVEALEYTIERSQRQAWDKHDCA